MTTYIFPLFEWMMGADHQDPPPGNPAIRPGYNLAIKSQDKLAMNLLTAGRTAKAVRLYKRILADCERALGADHPSTLRARNNLAMSYRAAGRTAEAIPLLEQTIADCERVLGADHRDTKAVRENLVALTGEPRPRDLRRSSGEARRSVTWRAGRPWLRPG